ncbi:NADP oxidoreductase [Luteibacter pinisoli]|uniref:NADP oxidoreductase n=1 Tax=Luteibacter pinisoli TaxID=2589080 RepID=A0A4Y5Z731_9GAMM|nr:NAD(P)-binding domain-containing protein [Luteibacter pinisoli]QDE41300.1 NADP oxidoreductase [Luteibacter pinisoli]
MLSIGIMGAGMIGGAIAQRLGAKGIAATIANSRGPETLKDLVTKAGPSITAGTREQAAAKDIVFVSVKWPALQGALAGLDWNGRILIDTNNNMQKPPLPPIDIGGRASTSIVQEWAPGARVVKAFNHHFFMNLEKSPDADGGRRVLFYAGDDEGAKAEVASLIDQLGFFGLDLGDVEHGSRLFQSPGGPLIAHDFVKVASPLP